MLFRSTMNYMDFITTGERTLIPLSPQEFEKDVDRVARYKMSATQSYSTAAQPYYVAEVLAALDYTDKYLDTVPETNNGLPMPYNGGLKADKSKGLEGTQNVILDAIMPKPLQQVMMTDTTIQPRTIRELNQLVRDYMKKLQAVYNVNHAWLETCARVERERLAKSAKKELYQIESEEASKKSVKDTASTVHTMSGLTTTDDDTRAQKDEPTEISNAMKADLDTSSQPCYALISEKGCNAGSSCKRSHKRSVILAALRKQLAHAETNVKYDPE